MKLAALILTCMLLSAPSLRAWPFVGMTAPDFILDQSTSGPDSIRLSDMLGEVVYLSFFGYTCSVCMADAPLSEAIYDYFAGNPAVNTYGIDVWNGPAAYINGPWRTTWGISYPILINGRTTGVAYDMENNGTVPADCEGRGHLVIDQQGIVQYYANYDAFGETERDEIITTIESLLDPCFGISELDAPGAVLLVPLGETGYQLWWQAVDCATQYRIMKSVTGDWADGFLFAITDSAVYTVAQPAENYAIYSIIAERQTEH
ncbi:MAG: redoxin domain-containing protein [Calditrichaeota bacterium]|nr:redoxin domain-containing protein [Calditrichota bacterium]MCB9365801.1 redoxin domain-containing protein [Calditrichota bacterium]